jgi:nucleotidyltransferase/DNA polymerase involved in DNA repair
LGGKLGSSLQEDLGVNAIGDLLKFSEQKLQDHFGINTGYAELGYHLWSFQIIIYSYIL